MNVIFEKNIVLYCESSFEFNLFEFKGTCQLGFSGERCENSKLKTIFKVFRVIVLMFYFNRNNSVLDPCTSMTCQNNATCIGNRETREVACICPLGFTGVHCENG